MREISRRGFIGAALAATAKAAETVIDIHQHTNYAGRTDAELIAHQRRMGISRTVLLPAGSKYGLDAQAGGNDTVVALTRANPSEFTYFANELPDIPETKPVIEKYLKTGCDRNRRAEIPRGLRFQAMQLVFDIAPELRRTRAHALPARYLQHAHRALPHDAGEVPACELHRSRANLVGQHRQESRPDGDVSRRDK